MGLLDLPGYVVGGSGKHGSNFYSDELVGRTSGVRNGNFDHLFPSNWFSRLDGKGGIIARYFGTQDFNTEKFSGFTDLAAHIDASVLGLPNLISTVSNNPRIIYSGKDVEFTGGVGFEVKEFGPLKDININASGSRQGARIHFGIKY